MTTSTSPRAPHTRRQVVRSLAHVAHLLVQHVEIGEHSPFALPKATVVADCAQLACQIRTALGPRGGKPCTHATVLGVDALGCRGRCAARRSARVARAARALAIRTLLCRIARPSRSGRAVNCFAFGLRPAATYGA